MKVQDRGRPCTLPRGPARSGPARSVCAHSGPACSGPPTGRCRVSHAAWPSLLSLSLSSSSSSSLSLPSLSLSLSSGRRRVSHAPPIRRLLSPRGWGWGGLRFTSGLLRCYCSVSHRIVRCCCSLSHRIVRCYCSVSHRIVRCCCSVSHRIVPAARFSAAQPPRATQGGSTAAALGSGLIRVSGSASARESRGQSSQRDSRGL